MRRAASTLLIALLALGCRPVSRQPVAATPEEQVRAVLAQLLAADNAGDAEAAAAVYSEDAVLVPAEGPRIVGRDAILQRYRTGVEAFALEIAAEVHALRVIGERAMLRGVTRGRIVWRDGTEPAPFDDGFVMLLASAGGNWQIRRLLWRPLELPAPAPERGDVVIHCGTLIDGVGEGARRTVDVLVADGLILDVAPEIEVPEGFTEIDLRDRVCLPGLGDLHTHINDPSAGYGDMAAFLSRTDEQQAWLDRDNSMATLRAGFTFIRNLATYRGGTDVALAAAIERGEVVGPRVQAAAFYLTAPLGGGDLQAPGVAEQDIPAYFRRGVSRGAEQFREHAEAAVAAGATVLKVLASGAVLAYGGLPGEPEMTPEEIAAVVEVGHAHGLKVAAHAHGARSIKEAILAGVDSVEHASYIDDEGIALAVEHGVALAMDTYNGTWSIDNAAETLPEEFLLKMRDADQAQRDGFRRAVAAGAGIVYATDAGVLPHGLNGHQFAMMVQDGMTPMQAIRAATSVAAEAMGWGQRLGALEPGLYGDLIAVYGDPLADIAVLEHVDTVIKGGVIVVDRRSSEPLP